MMICLGADLQICLCLVDVSVSSLGVWRAWWLYAACFLSCSAAVSTGDACWVGGWGTGMIGGRKVGGEGLCDLFRWDQIGNADHSRFSATELRSRLGGLVLRSSRTAVVCLQSFALGEAAWASRGCLLQLESGTK